MSEHKEPIPSRIYNAAVGGHVAGAEDIFDDAMNKNQSTINQEFNEAIGTGGSVDSKISAAINALDSTKSQSAGADGLVLNVVEENGKITSISGSIASNTYDAYGAASQAQAAAATDATNKVNAAKSEIKGNATSACDTLGEAEALISAEKTRAQAAEEQLRTLYNNLQQSQPVPVTSLPATGEAGKIYRLAGTTSYADYMYAEGALTTPIKMAEYDNAIDDEPTAGSDNLVKSQGMLSSLTNLSFCGHDTTFVSQEVKGLLKGHLYTLSFKNTDWEKHQDTRYSIFELWYKDTNDVTHDLINIQIGGTVYECFPFIIPDEAECVYYGGRAKDGVIVRFSITDAASTKIIPVSNNNPISNNVKIEQNTITIKDDGFGLVNVVAGNTIGWIGYVSGEDESTSITINPDSNDTNCVYYIDLKTLNADTRTSFSSAIKKASLRDGKYKGYIVAAYRKSQLIYTPLKDVIKKSEIRDEVFIMGNNHDLDTNVILSEDGNSITLSQNGFAVCRTTSSVYNNIVGYVAYVEGVDENPTFTFTGDGNSSKTFYYLDLSVLNSQDRTAFKNAIKITHTRIEASPKYILLLSFYYDRLDFYGLFGSIVAKKAYYTAQRPAQINLLNFEPEFYAYSKGRFNSAQGEGQGWYDRFKIGHISDTHQYQVLMREAIEISKPKVDVLINTGDDGNGMPSWTSERVIANLMDTASVVNSNIGSLKYFVTPGNHDVPNITKKQYYDVMSPYFSDSYIWGDNEHYRMYGYEDITANDMGTFRIIVLDPFDYDDGAFPETRSFQTATFSQKQIDWLTEALVYAANNSYHVITMMHYSFGDNSLYFNEEKAKPDAVFYQDPFMIPDIIDAIQNKTILNKVYSDSQNINNITVNSDFSSVGNLDYVCHLFGHIHSKNSYWCQKTDGSKVYDILMLGESALGEYGNALNKVYRMAGTLNEIEFSALEIDTIEKAIYRVNYGAYLKYDGSNNVTNRTTKLNYRKDM